MPQEETIQGVGQLSRTISDYGPTIVIIAVFLLVFIAMFTILIVLYKKQTNTLSSNYDDQSKALLAQNKLILEALINNHKEDEKELVSNYIESSIVFKNASKMALDKMKADRVAIYVFHNGNSSTHGFPFFKMSCVGEWLHKSLDLNCRMRDHINMPLYAYSGIVEKLYNHGCFENLSDLNNEASELTMFTGTLEKERIYMLALRDDNDNLAGFSMVKFKQSPMMTIQEIKEVMEELNYSIKGIIIDSKLQKRLKN